MDECNPLKESDFMSRQEAAAALRVAVTVIDALIRTGLLARYRTAGRYVRVLRSQVDELKDVDPQTLREA